MGLTASSTGTNLLNDNFALLKEKCDFTIALSGNPNVGKSTIFNSLTGMHQHTGNWPGKTVTNACGECNYKSKDFLFIDLPGTYSIMSNSEEEKIARDYICFGNPDATIVVLDATCLERHLNLAFQIMEMTSNVIVCVNLLDEAEKKGIKIDLDLLSNYLGVPVVGTSARKKKTLKKLLDTTYKVCSKQIIPLPKEIKYNLIIEECISYVEKELDNKIDSKLSRWVSIKLIDGEDVILESIEKNLNINLHSTELLTSVNEAKSHLVLHSINSFKDEIVSTIMFNAETICNDVCKIEESRYNSLDRKFDKILTSKKFGIPIMILFLGIIFWITIVGANYPSEVLSRFFSYIQLKLLNFADYIHTPIWLSSMLILGIYQTVTWIISVMLPPMAIFFPLFTFLEDLGYLPRIAFNLDGYFKKACTTGKQMITMCMGFGCNAARCCWLQNY